MDFIKIDSEYVPFAVSVLAAIVIIIWKKLDREIKDRRVDATARSTALYKKNDDLRTELLDALQERDRRMTMIQQDYVRATVLEQLLRTRDDAINVRFEELHRRVDRCMTGPSHAAARGASDLGRRR